MSDPLDIATEREQIARDAAITHRRPEGPAPTGFCLYCSYPRDKPQRWCPWSRCRDLWEKEQRRFGGKR